MFCSSCGKELPEKAAFCSECGAPVSVPPVEPKLPEIPVEEIPVGMEPPIEEPVQNGEAAPEQPAEPVSEAAPEQSAEPAPDAVLEMQPVRPVPAAGNAPVLAEAKKKGKGMLLVGIAAAAVVLLIVALVMMLPSGGKDVLVYASDDNELMFRKDLKAKTKPEELTDDETAGVLFSKDGKYIYYLESQEDAGYDYDYDYDYGYGGRGTLYRVETAQIGKKGFSPEKVSPDVSLYNVSILDNGGAVYIRGSDGDGQLRYYDGKESYKLASGVRNFILNEKGTYAYYTEYDSSGYTYTYSLYRVEVKDGGGKERLLKDVNRIYSSYDADVLVYGKYSDAESTESEDIYSQAPGGDKTKLLSDVYCVVDVTISGSKVSVIYATKQAGDQHTYYDFFTDSMAASDASAREPSTSDYQTYGYWGWTTDWEAYEEAYEVWEAVEMRNDIRQNLKDYSYNLSTYTLHRYENGEDTVLAEGMSSAYPDYSAADGIYIYEKRDQDISKVGDVSDLEYWDDYDIIERISSSRQDAWYQNVNGTESELDLGGDDGAGVSSLYVLNGKEAVLTVYGNGERSIRAYSIGKDSMTFSSTVTDDNFICLCVGKNGKQDVFYYFTDITGEYSYGDLMYYVDGKKTAVAKDAAQAVLLDDGKAVFKMEDVAYNSRREVTECSLYVVKDGKNERIADDVALYNIAFLDAKQVLYISDGDLFVWNGSASERLAGDVTSFWVSRRADRQDFSLEW